MVKKKSKPKEVLNEIMHDYIDCPKCGGDMLPSKITEEGKLYKCDDCKSTEIVKAK